MSADKNKKAGKIIVPPGVFPERHELETAAYFAVRGKDVEFLLPVRTKGAKTPDVLIGGVTWEMKCVFGNGRETILKCIKRASKQSKNIIIDLRHTSLKTESCLKEINREFKLRKTLKRIEVITKAETNNFIVLSR